MRLIQSELIQALICIRDPLFKQPEEEVMHALVVLDLIEEHGFGPGEGYFVLSETGEQLLEIARKEEE